MQNLYENFFHETFYTRLNYSNRAVIHVNHTKIFKNFYHEKFLHENKANYGIQHSLMVTEDDFSVAGQGRQSRCDQ